MKADIRVAWILARAAGPRERWRTSLTSLGALSATGFALAAITVAAIPGQVSIPYAHGLLDRPGERAGIAFSLVLLLIPVLAFLGQCARIGAVHRDRRTAGMRLAGATARQVRRIAGAESALACLVGSVTGLGVFAVLLAVTGHSPRPLVWAAFGAVVLLVPLLAAAVSVLALRRVISSPLGHFRRTTPGRGRGTVLGFLLAALLIATAALLVLLPRGGAALMPLLVLALVLLTGAGALWTVGASAALIGRKLTHRAKHPSVLIAAARLAHDPWAAARTHAALLLVTVVGVAFTGVRGVLLAELTGRQYPPGNLAFYTTGIDLAGAAVLTALAISLCGLAVGAAESVATRRSGLAAQAAAGVPHRVLAMATLLETALPLAPALVLAGAGGAVVYLAYAAVVGNGFVPLLPLLVPFAIHAACLLAAATSLPLLRRVSHPSELRFT
ncbi:FtsX-like permease family protein [Streptomyces sp. NPDC048305]|uniref:FtsX-like permease family protein n=1 Tax=Streptomyces sp. NPDC048305 TaxID=3365532 RepID=UPI0037216D51